MLLLAIAPLVYGQGIQITRAGSPAPAPSAGRFTGTVTVDTAFQMAVPGHPSNGSRVTFAPGARTDWHTHPAGQLLIVTAGTGRVQRHGDAAAEMRAGDVVWIPPGVKHWHGAAPGTAVTQVAVTEPVNGKTVDWLEKVTDAEYAPAPTAPPARPSQRAMGDFAPKLAEITDNVLYADVWERPGLSKRDRSLATVSALIALYRPEQLRSHLERARENGLTQAEVVEAITHLAFYTGWPNAVTAIGVAKEVFGAGGKR